MANLAGFDPASLAEAAGLDDLDRVLVRPAPAWMRRLWRGDVGAMTLPWGIFVRSDLLGGNRVDLARLVSHELVHVRQWQQMGIRRFLTRYLSDYWRARRQGHSHQVAYEMISLEKEAREISGV